MSRDTRFTQLEPGLRRVLAPNPSPMTFRGTNSYIVGTGDVAVIDPGPAMPAHLDALLAALEPGERISHIFITHSHLDHSPLARPLAERTGAPVLAFGTHEEGRSPIMAALAADGMLGGGEGIDTEFAPDIRLADGDTVEAGDWSLQALWTPGHIANHLSFAWNGAVFTGDHVMGWASSLISPPDGDLTAFMASCEKLKTRQDRRYYPGHGDAVENPQERLAWLIHHRRERERQILELLSRAPRTVETLVRGIYTDTPEALFPAAARNVLAHIIDLSTKKMIFATSLPDGMISLRHPETGDQNFETNS
ncbi:MBL fold metallo-hydrolase [Aliiruegeria lutimaris]|uniref:Glyoxylase, beta-lactamase superfamily II n=1 Tax=Aliiruegeria lutimaris TaxID=571298 RepID=A0A1G9GC93_9RHOB|nr:MBL fold metallo-hydrolase [Aliiruegeria lutimaris]SDK97893.1 Glyoxylase, beta-lactamase superfamily II [Aliiruegeria lutimaris]